MTFDTTSSRLSPYQQRGVEWMVHRESLRPQEEGGGTGGVLADDMGLGKTHQIAGLIAARPLADTLIVIHQAVMSHWVETLQAATGRMPWVVHTSCMCDLPIGGFRPSGGNVVIAFYSSFQVHRKSPPDNCVLRPETCMMRRAWSRVVLDEAHHIRNPKTATFAALMGIHAIHRWALTGTPVNNRAADFSAIAHWLRLSALSDAILKGAGEEKEKDATPSVAVVPSDGTGAVLRRTVAEVTESVLPSSRLETRIVRLPFKFPHESRLYSMMRSPSTSEDARGRGEEEEEDGRKKRRRDEDERRSGEGEHRRKRRRRHRHGHRAAAVASSDGKHTTTEYDGREHKERSRRHHRRHRSRRSERNREGGRENEGQDVPHSGRQGEEKDVAEGGGKKNRGKEMETLLRLRQVCSHTWLFAESMERKRCSSRAARLSDVETRALELASRHADAPSTKSEFVCDRTQELCSADPDAKVLVFCEWVREINILEVEFRRRGMRGTATFHGGLDVLHKAEALHTFQTDPGARVLLVQIQTGGSGINLQCARHVIITSPSWNPFQDVQAIVRAFRRGQAHHTVTCERVVIAGTVEERCLDRQYGKLRAAERIMGDAVPSQRLGFFTDDRQSFGGSR